MTKSKPASVVLLVVALPMAGCLAGISEDPAALSDEEPPDPPVTVHGPDKTPLDPEAYPGTLPQMEQRYVGRGLGYEPTAAVSTKGTAFYPTYAGVHPDVPISLSQMSMMRSRDDGRSWQDVTPQIAGRDAVPLAFDPITYVDPATDRLFFAYSYAGCMEVLWSDDEGATWDRNPASCALPVNDHETLFTGPPVEGGDKAGYPTWVYLCSSQLSTFYCLHSGDGGRTWNLPDEPIISPLEKMNPASAGGCPVDDRIFGHGRASPVDGTVYIPFNLCDRSYVALSEDHGQTWETHLVDDEAGEASHEARVAIDAANNVYFLWVGEDRMPRLARSDDRGRTWTDPVVVAEPHVTYATARYIGIAAGTEGRIALFYLGSEVEGGPDADAAAMEEATWHAFVSYSLDADEEDPVFATTTANPPDDPLYRGDCSGSSDACGAGTNSMAHYLDLGSHPATGQVWAALIDSCREACASSQEPPRSDARNRATVGVQVGGSLLGPAWHHGP